MVVEPYTTLRNTRPLPSLDGWRAFSILWVLIAHAQHIDGCPDSWKFLLRWLPDGECGVQFFFVISGFLITWLLLKERESTGRISQSGFYWRRAIPILPAYAVYLLVLFVLSHLDKIQIPWYSFAGMLTFTTNYIHTPWTGAHIWSLSVEEQFYFVWPIVFVAIVHKYDVTIKPKKQRGR